MNKTMVDPPFVPKLRVDVLFHCKKLRDVLFPENRAYTRPLASVPYTGCNVVVACEKEPHVEMFAPDANPVILVAMREYTGLVGRATVYVE